MRQEDLANALGVSRQTIIAIENDKYDPTLALAIKISLYFGRTVNEIFMFNEEPFIVIEIKGANETSAHVAS